jgi:hypothetical protein
VGHAVAKGVLRYSPYSSVLIILRYVASLLPFGSHLLLLDIRDGVNGNPQKAISPGLSGRMYCVSSYGITAGRPALQSKGWQD